MGRRVEAFLVGVGPQDEVVLLPGGAGRPMGRWRAPLAPLAAAVVVR